MNESHDKDCHIAEECKVTIKKKQSAAAQWTLPDMLDFGSFFWLGDPKPLIQKF